jgi:hypothetical protein
MAVVSVSSFGFVAGAMSYSAARQRRFEDAAGRSDRAFDPQELLLRPGNYVGFIDVEFPFPAYTREAGPPIWHGGTKAMVTTNEFEFSISGR